MSDTPIKFTRGKSSNLPKTYEDGKIYFCHDTGNLKIDYGSKRYTLVSSNNTGVQQILGGLVVGDTTAQSLGKGRIMATGQGNPLFGLQAVDDNNKKLTPYYLQVTKEDKLYLGPTSMQAMSFDKEGNITFPNTVTQGKYAVLDSEKEYAYVIGNGSSTRHSNAYTLDWEGDVWFAGNVYVGSTSGTNKDAGSKKLATEEDLNTKLAGAANKSEGAFFIEGGGTTDATNKVSTWTGTSDRITEYYDGLTIRYKIGVEGQSTVTLNINNLGAKTVYRFNTTKLTTHFPVGSIIHLIYHSDLNDGCWITNDYDANTNTYQRVYESSSKNVEYPITARYATTTGSSYYAEYGRYTSEVTLNPSTKTITATAFKGKLTGNADTATKATQDSNGNTITATYAKKADVYTKIEIDKLIGNILNGES